VLQALQEVMSGAGTGMTMQPMTYVQPMMGGMGMYPVHMQMTPQMALQAARGAAYQYAGACRECVCMVEGVRVYGSPPG
jgi:hypothetical protein